MPPKKKMKCFICNSLITGRKYKSKYQSNFGRADEDLIPNKEVKLSFVFIFCSYEHMSEFDKQFAVFFDTFRSANQKSMVDYLQEDDKE